MSKAREALKLAVWQDNAELRACTLATRGFWIDILCWMKPRRTATLFGSAAWFADITRCSPAEAQAAIEELDQTKAAEILRVGDLYGVTCRQLLSETIPGFRAWVSSHREFLVDKLTKRDGPGCRKCGAGEPLQIDHIHPLSWGGLNDIGNLQLLCAPCNGRKWAKVGG